MADTTFRTVLPALRAVDNGDGTYSVAVVMATGTNLIGKVAIDQTTPGTTNGVQVDKTLGREYFDHYLVTGNAVLDAQQYTTPVVTDTQDTDEVVLTGTYEPTRAGVLKEVEFSIPVYLTAVANTPNAKITVQARDKNGTWVNILPVSSGIATSVTEIVKVVQGRFTLVANFDAVPFDYQVLVQSDHATDFVSARIGGAARISGYFEVA